MTNYNNQNYGQGEAASYYASAGQQQNSNGQQEQQDGPAGERGFLGALGGAVAGGAGGHAIGGKTGHSKTSTIIGAIAGAVAGHKLQDGVEDWKDKRDEEKDKKKREEEEAKKREEEEKRRKEDDERRRREDEERRKNEQNRPQQQQHHNDNRGVSYAGNFSGSARDARLDAHGDFMLHASCARLDGSYHASSIALNKIIENSNGSFRWISGRPSGGNNNCDSNKPRQVTVQAGDTLRDIGSRVGVSWQDIARQNNLSNPDLIHPGQLLQIPQGGGGGNGGGSGNFGASARNVRLEDGKRLVGELLRGDGQWVGASLALDERIGNDNGTLTFKN
ncbi:CVNH domain-containing protein [Podospora fimiseda]|uniref:CVNH domain-containing protein n=1 Tax=Podospora fimiseda TaxID=252190 RepID=A0AAN7BVQ2_9PEZI|nr:CVNH domain-containing protein [Podospora fimiseda]